MRQMLVAAALAAVPLTGLLAAPANAVCDPDYEPLCLNECMTRPPDATNPLEYIKRVCPR